MIFANKKRLIVFLVNILLRINGYNSNPCVRQFPKYAKYPFFAFGTNIYELLMTKSLGVKAALEEISNMGVDVFQYRRLLFPIDCYDYRSLFVVSDSAYIRKSLDRPDGSTIRAGDPFTG